MMQVLLNDIVFLAAAACCVAFLILAVVLLERYNRLRDQLVADEALEASARPTPPSTVSGGTGSREQPTAVPGAAEPVVQPTPVAPSSASPTTVPSASVRQENAPPVAPRPAGASGITEEHNLRAQMHELTQLLGTMNESLHHYDAARVQETEKLAAAMRTLGEALAAFSRRLQVPGASNMQSIEEKLDRIVAILEKGRTGGA